MQSQNLGVHLHPLLLFRTATVAVVPVWLAVLSPFTNSQLVSSQVIYVIRCINIYRFVACLLTYLLLF